MRVCGSNSRTTPADLAALISSADVVSLVRSLSSQPTPPVSACALAAIVNRVVCTSATCMPAALEPVCRQVIRRQS